MCFRKSAPGLDPAGKPKVIEVVEVEVAIVVERRGIGRAGNGIGSVHGGERGKLGLASFGGTMVKGDGAYETGSPQMLIK